MLPSHHPFDPLEAERLARLALGCIHREYPNQIAHALSGDADVRPPRVLHPAFFGSYDWHSAVHGHWCLVRLVRLFPQAPWAAQARAAVDRSLIRGNIEAEAAYLAAPGREGFERPYGLAWLLQLAAELREWTDPDARRWSEHLEPLEDLCRNRLTAWLPKLTHPIRSGEHSQTAFAMGLAVDWARTAQDAAFEKLLIDRALDFHLHDHGWPLAFEPSGHDFLSPSLAEADLMRRVLGPVEFAAWLDAFLPDVPRDGSGTWLEPVTSPDPADGKLAHLDGLSLSRAWMLEGIVSGLPPGDSRVPALKAAAEAHRQAGLASVTGEHYAGAHWLASFAVYLITRRGIKARNGW
jgi:hypothetical protein